MSSEHSNKKINQIVAGSLLSYVQMGASTIISLIYTPVMLSLLGKTEYGLYNIAAATISYITLLDFGFTNSYIRFYSQCKAKKDDEALRRTDGLFLIVFIIIGLLALVAGLILTFSAKYIFADGLTDSELMITKKIMLILTFSTAFYMATSVFSAMITAHERFVFQKTVNLIRTVFSPAIMWVLLLSGYRSVMMALVTGGLSVVVNICFIVYAVAKLKVKFDVKHPDMKQLKEVFAFSSFIAIGIIVDQINWSIDKVLLGRFRGAVSAAVYSVAAQLNILYMQISTAISSVFVPRVNRIVAERNDDKELTNLFIKVGKVQLLVLSPVILGFILLGQAFIRLWAPDGYGDAYYIALLLMVPATLPYIQNIGVSIQTAKAKHKFRAYLYLGMALFNLAISIILCQMYGAIGCAIGTAISLVAANNIIMNIHYQKAIKLDMKRYFRSIFQLLPALLVTAALSLPVVIFIPVEGYLQLALCALIIIIIYAICVWLFGLNKDEKLSIRHAVHSLLPRKSN